MNLFCSRIFSTKQIIFLGAGFVLIFVFIQRIYRYICENQFAFDCPYYFPMSIFTPRLPTLQDLIISFTVGLLFILFVKVLEVQKYSLKFVVLFAILLIAGSNLIQGVNIGYYAPIAGDARTGHLIPFSSDGQEYYHEALKIKDPVEFF